MRLIYTVGNHHHLWGRHTALQYVGRQYVGDWKHKVGVAPRHTFCPSGEPGYTEPSVQTAFLRQRGIDLQQQGQTHTPLQNGARKQEQVVALVDDIRLEFSGRL